MYAKQIIQLIKALKDKTPTFCCLLTVQNFLLVEHADVLIIIVIAGDCMYMHKGK